jgi:tetratricopeptide (TPR) repeat protein
LNSFHILALLLLASPILAQTRESIQDPHFDKGVALLRQQQYVAALPELEQAQRAHPAVSKVENLLGITTTQLGQIPIADAHYRKAIALNPQLPGPHKNLGFNLLNEKQYTAAEQELKTALALDHSDRFTHYYLGILHLATSQDAQAVEQLPPSQTLLGNDPENELLMARACIATGHSPEALALIQSLADHAQLTAPQNYDLAVFLSANKLYPEAVQRFEYALAADPDSWAAQYDLAIAQLNAGHADKALPFLQSLAEQQPGNPAILSFLGTAYESADQLPQALDAYRNAVRANAQNPDRYLDYTRLLMDLDRTEEASKVIEDGIQQQRSGGTDNPYALDIRLGVLRVKQARYDEARSAFDQAIILHPELAVGYVALAQSFMQQGSDDKALEPLLKARAALAQDATLDYYVGLVSLRLGRIPEAETALNNSARLRPDVAEAHYQLGKLYLQTNRLKQAQSEFERVIVLAPANSNAHYQLSKLYARVGDMQKANQMAEETRHPVQTQREAALLRQKSRLTNFQPPPAN